MTTCFVQKLEVPWSYILEANKALDLKDQGLKITTTLKINNFPQS